MKGRRGAAGAVRPVTAAVGVVTLIGTLALAALAQMVNHDSNSRLLHQQVRQAASALAAALPAIQTEMSDGLQVAQATGSSAAFTRFMTPRVGSTGFASVSLWRRTGSTVTVQAVVGAQPALIAAGRAQGFLGSAPPSTLLHIAGILRGPQGDRIGYADLPPGGEGLIVYAESALPAERHLRVPRQSAFSDLNFALYLGPTASPSGLIESSVPTPIRGLEASSTVAFGDSFITVVGIPTTQLSGGLSASLPWIVLGAGLLFGIGSMVLAEYVLRRRSQAEGLAEENERLYLEQRRIASDFQHALLPDLPTIAGLEVGARYIAGTAGLDVGGDWYDVIDSGPGECTFVIGDVCGRGLRAATTMASLRFASRAYVIEGEGPEVVLEKLGRLQDLDDESFATVLIGKVSLDTGEVTIVSAGHPPPLLLVGGEASFVALRPSIPIGVGRTQPLPVTLTVPPGAILVAYTDGLVERRGESVDQGMERLRSVDIPDRIAVEEVLDRLVGSLLGTTSPDDAAILVMRRAEPTAGAADRARVSGYGAR